MNKDLFALGTFLASLGGFLTVLANIYIGIRGRRSIATQIDTRSGTLSTQLETVTNGQTEKLLAASHAVGKAEGVQEERNRGT